MVYKIWYSVYKIVQNEYKTVIQFFMLKLHLGDARLPHPTTKFELRLTKGGRMYKISNLVYKIVQISTKLWSTFLCWNFIWGDACLPPPFQNLNTDSARRKGVQNLVLDVQNCTKWVQNYDPVFYVETAFGGLLHVTSHPNLNCR